ncbi:MAG: guanylate kinase [Cyanobacteria bacterium K_Offshore_surface_m2_239]|nr:guanylate kinase [Cyanobacteria bacterium K_Offshore_surface_m2_239]
MTQPPGPPHPAAAAQLTVLTGPSGVGKGTLVRELLARHPELWLSVSATTRAPREGEVEGEHYFFLTPERFARQVEEGGFLEWAAFAGNRYGTPRAAVEEMLAAGRPVLLEIEVEGARQVRRSFPAGRQIFVAPPSFAELERRIRGRGTDAEEAIARRLARAREELAAAAEFDAVLVNDDLTAAGRELERLLGLIPKAPAEGG